MKNIIALGKFEAGEKVMFRNGDGKSVFGVVDCRGGFARIKPGVYGQEDMIIESNRLKAV